MAKAKKLPSGNWNVRVYDGKDADGKERYQSFTAATKKQAEYLAAEYAAKKKRHVEHMTVGEAIDRYIASKDAVLSPTTIAEYKRMRRNYLQSLMSIPIDRLSREQIQVAVNEQAKQVSAKTVINAHGLLSAALAMHNPDFVLRTTLPRKVKKLKRDLPTAEEVMEIMHGQTAELPVLLALCLCLRMSEVRGIRKSAVHGNMLSIDRVIVTSDGQHIEKELLKTDESRRIEELPDFLRDMILSQPTEYATTMTGHAIYKAFTRRMKKAGYENVRFHDLRHISASDMHSQGISDKVASERGGWSGTQTMRQVYQHSFSAERQAADKIMNERYSKIYHELQKPETKHETER
jgi:integrase